MGYNGYGTVMRNTVELLAFHDERRVRNWLYHGFMLCEVDDFPQLRDQLINAKGECGCDIDKRIHFSELGSGGTGSSRTRTAVAWAKLFATSLHSSMWFYFFGINLRNIDYEFFGPSTAGRARDFRIYNRFFEIGLFGACRFFFDSESEDVKIVDIVSEKRDLEKDNPFLIHVPYRINRRASNIEVRSRRVVQAASHPCRETIHPEYAHLVNFVDVLIGSFSEVIDYTTRKDGCIEVAEKIFPVCTRLLEDPYNKNSRYYKKYAVSFFPRRLVSKSAIMKYDARPPQDMFYWNRAPRLHQPECFPGFEGLIT
jgi:hypothetical protein